MCGKRTKRKKRKGKETKKGEELEGVGGVKGRKITRNRTVCTYRSPRPIDNNPEACVFALFALFASCSTNTVLRFDPKAHLLVVRAAFLSMLADGDGDGVAMAIRFACCCCLLLLLLLLCFFYR